MPLRSWWRNCAREADAEILEIDAMEDRISPLAPGTERIRELISTLEMCHHKAERWVHNIVEAIGSGQADKGLGTRSPGQHHDAEQVWQSACAALAAWCAGCPGPSLDGSIGAVPAAQMVARLGERSPVKEWQVQRVVDKIRSFLHWPQSDSEPASEYNWILFAVEENELAYHTRCPERYREHEEHWQATVRTIIHDRVDGGPAELSLGLAIDMLWPCHWRFVENLELVLGAIGGNLCPRTPFAACGRNITLSPLRGRMETVSAALQAFCGGSRPEQEADRQILALLGEPTETKRWLAGSLDKTIRLQLDPPAGLRCLSALAGPAWIRE